jgi:hypothetical protein
LFLAGGVELRKRGNGRHLPQQPQSIKTPLLDGGGRPRQLRPLRGAGELIKLNPLGTEQGHIGTVITVIDLD